MGSTAVARNCGEVTRDLVARHMCHDPKMSLAHYQATTGDKDSASAFNTIKSLRIDPPTNPSTISDSEAEPVAHKVKK